MRLEYNAPIPGEGGILLRYSLVLGVFLLTSLVVADAARKAKISRVSISGDKGD